MRVVRRSHAIEGVARGGGRRARYTESFDIEGTTWDARRKDGALWASRIEAAFERFKGRAASALGEHGGAESFTWQAFYLVSSEESGRLEKASRARGGHHTKGKREPWEEWQSGYKRPDTTKAEIGDALRGWGDHDKYEAYQDGDETSGESKPIRARPIAVIFRAISPEGNGHALPDASYRNVTETKRRKPKAEKQRPVKPSGARSVSDAVRANPTITNAELYKLFPNRPQASVRRDANESGIRKR